MDSSSGTIFPETSEDTPGIRFGSPEEMDDMFPRPSPRLVSLNTGGTHHEGGTPMGEREQAPASGSKSNRHGTVDERMDEIDMGMKEDSKTMSPDEEKLVKVKEQFEAAILLNREAVDRLFQELVTCHHEYQDIMEQNTLILDEERQESLRLDKLQAEVEGATGGTVGISP